ncbi:hypothetical protein DITRI_Ditri02bG0163500 [Diplodiscus trichospermus]
MQVFDLHSNLLQGSLPAVLPSTEFLSLSNNKLSGKIPPPFCNRSSLGILDLSNNNLNGRIPHCLGNFSSSLLVLDLRMNNFYGSIPAEFGNCEALTTLATISVGKFPETFPETTFLVGHIPSSLGSLTNIEWLDLSSNELSGKIPEQLANITFPEVLNLSYNKLIGQIPVGRQFNTFSNDSFIANFGLCGLPLSKKCNQNETQAPPAPSFAREQNASGFKSGFGWKVLAVGYGCGVILGLIMGYLVFTTGKPQWLVRLVEADQPRRKLKRPRIGRGRHGIRIN